MNALRGKLRSTRGESISEVMISGLIVALGLLLAVSMILASVSMMSKASTSWKSYFTARNELESRTGTASNITVTVGGITGLTPMSGSWLYTAKISDGSYLYMFSEGN